MIKKTIYLPENLVDEIQEVAKQEFRSFASQILYTLDREYGRRYSTPYYHDGGIKKVTTTDPYAIVWHGNDDPLAKKRYDILEKDDYFD